LTAGASAPFRAGMAQAEQPVLPALAWQELRRGPRKYLDSTVREQRRAQGRRRELRRA